MSYHGPTDDFRLSLLLALHDFQNDAFMLSLYTRALPRTIDAYTNVDEVEMGQYEPGGQPITVTPGYPKLELGSGVVRFDKVIWSPALFYASHGLIYNSSKDNRSVAVLYFGQTLTANGGTFEVHFPMTAQPLIAL